MDSIINLMVPSLRDWAKDLSNEDIANILTNVGSAYTPKKEPEPVLSSANIGLLGENQVQQILQERYKIINTAKSGKCGDFIIELRGIRILIEVKKYSKTVPSLEVEKFYRDIDSNSSINGAILISLSSKIVGMDKCMVYTHQYMNGENKPIIFLSLKDIVEQSISKECMFSAVDILTTEFESKNKYIDISENIANAVDNIETNLNFLSRCRLMIHETQAMFNNQLGKLMQQVLSAEINIKSSIKVLKSKVETIGLEDLNNYSTKDILSKLNIELDEIKYNMLYALLEGQDVSISKTKNIIQTKDKKMSIKVTKSKINVSISMELNSTIEIDGNWTYNGKAIDIVLTEKTLHTILGII